VYLKTVIGILWAVIAGLVILGAYLVWDEYRPAERPHPAVRAVAGTTASPPSAAASRSYAYTDLDRGMYFRVWSSLLKGLGMIPIKDLPAQDLTVVDFGGRSMQPGDLQTSTYVLDWDRPAAPSRGYARRMARFWVRSYVRAGGYEVKPSRVRPRFLGPPTSVNVDDRLAWTVRYELVIPRCTRTMVVGPAKVGPTSVRMQDWVFNTGGHFYDIHVDVTPSGRWASLKKALTLPATTFQSVSPESPPQDP
jgi:hypothetical protein